MRSKLTKKQTKTIGYLRVSTSEQDLGANKSEILMLANQKHLDQVEFIEEQASGRVSWRKRQIAKVIDELNDGDSLIVSELSRLGRSMLECMEILSIAMQRGICVYSVKGNWQLDHSIQSKIVAMAFENEDAVVEGASRAQEALDRMDFFKPDIVLADIDMKDLTGFDLSQKIKADSKFNTVKVLLLASDLEDFNKNLFDAVS